MITILLCTHTPCTHTLPTPSTYTLNTHTSSHLSGCLILLTPGHTARVKCGLIRTNIDLFFLHAAIIVIIMYYLLFDVYIKLADMRHYYYVERCTRLSVVKTYLRQTFQIFYEGGSVISNIRLI